jgi:hypothetical protein
VILRHKSPNRNHWFWGPNWETLHHLGFEAEPRKPTAGFEIKPGEIVATSFEAKLEKTVATGFEVKPEKTAATDFEAKPPETVATGFEAKPMRNRPSGFEAKAMTNHQTWFWGSIKKSALIVSMCAVQTAHGATWPLNRPAIEYPTCATISGSLHQVSYSCHDSRRCTSYRTCHLHTMRQANMIVRMRQR